MSKAEERFCHYEKLMKKVSDQAPASCRKCPYYQPEFKYRSCLYVRCPFEKRRSIPSDIAYTLYDSLITKQQPKSVLRSVQTLVFKALYIKNTGFLPDGTSDLPLTLRRDNSVFQNVIQSISILDLEKG